MFMMAHLQPPETGRYESHLPRLGLARADPNGRFP